jgi:hypothetical protein
MNRGTQGLLLSEAVDGFTQYKVVEGLSLNMLESHIETHGISLDTVYCEFTYT